MSTPTKDQGWLPSKRMKSRGQKSEKQTPGANGQAPESEPKSEPKKKRKPFVPGYVVRSDGVYYGDPAPDADKPLVYVCGPIEVVARTDAPEGDNCGRLLRWQDDQQRGREWGMPADATPEDVRCRLLRGGLEVNLLLKPAFLMNYLLRQRPEVYINTVEYVGWNEGCFVIPGQTFGTGSQPVIYQSRYEPDHRLAVRGTVESWREKVGQLCSGNPLLILGVSAGFAAPLLEIAGIESGGIHFHGKSSRGKTTLAIVAGSIVGGGGKKGYLQTWKTTQNGIEATAAAHCDVLLVLDELKQIDAKLAEDTVYMLMNEQGKQRMTSHLGMRQIKEWHLLLVSTGELTLADHMLSAGKRIQGGGEVRLINIPANQGKHGVLENLHGRATSRQLIDELAYNARRHYGAPLRFYLEHVVQNREIIREMIEAERQAIVKEFPADVSGEVFRAADRLALFSVGGEIATKLSITGWEPEEARRAAHWALKTWVAARGTAGHSDDQRGIQEVRRFIENHGPSRFQSAKTPERKDINGKSYEAPEHTHNRAGFVIENHGSEKIYHILPETFRKEVCSGLDPDEVAKALDLAGYLVHESGRLQAKPYIQSEKDENGNSRRIRGYSVKACILSGTDPAGFKENEEPI